MSIARHAARSGSVRPYSAMQPSRSWRKRRYLAMSRRRSKIMRFDARVRSVSKMLMRPPSRQRIVRVDQDERDLAWRGAAIDPGVVGRLLDQHVTGLEVDLALVEQHVDLARQHDRVVDALGAVHGVMARRPRLAGDVAVAHLARQVVGRQLDLVGARCELDDAEDRAAW